MNRISKLTAVVVGVMLAVGALAACAAQPSSPSPTKAVAVQQAKPAVAPTDATQPTELPQSAQGTAWVVYPKGLTCTGTEGCPNDYRAAFGEPGAVLPKGVHYYDAARDWLPSMPKKYAPKL